MLTAVAVTYLTHQLRKIISPDDIKPTITIDSLEHFKPELFGLPPFDT